MALFWHKLPGEQSIVTLLSGQFCVRCSIPAGEKEMRIVFLGLWIPDLSDCILSTESTLCRVPKAVQVAVADCPGNPTEDHTLLTTLSW
jgi:hypothetical protein